MVVGFIGLGHQGTPMAERMIGAGLRPWLWARRAEVLHRYRDADAVIAATPTELGAACDLIGLCMYDAAATDAVLFGDGGIVEAIRPGTVIAVHATTGPAYVRELGARLAGHGVAVVDAPVSGGDEPAAAGELLVIVAGDEAACAACAPMFATYSNKVVNVGALGNAQLAKLLNNGVMTAEAGLVFDAFALGEAHGLDPLQLGEVMSHGSAACFALDVYRGLGSSELFSIRAYPTLHKDVALIGEIAVGTPVEDGMLVTGAAATIAEMARQRAGYETARRGERS